MALKKIAFVIVLIVISVSVESFGFSRSLVFASDRVSIEVNPNEPGIRIPSNFIGFSYETSNLLSNEFLGGNVSTLMRLYRNLGSGVIRIGGNSLDRDGLNESAYGSIDRLIWFSKATNWSLIFGLPLGKYNASNAATLAEYVNSRADGQLLGFEVGNEPDLFSSNGIRSKSYGFSDYLGEFNSYYYEIREHAPDAPFAGPATAAHINDWLEPFARYEASRLALLTQHFYALGPAGNPSVTIPNLLSSKQRDRENQTATLLEAIAKKYNISVRMAETNSVYNGGQAGVSDVFASSLWAVDYMFTLASHGISGVNFHTGPTSKYTAIAVSGTNYAARPLYYGMLLFEIASKGRFIPLTQEGSPVNLDSYAILQDNGTVVLTLVNKESQENVEIAISADDLGAGYNATSVWLNGPGLESKTQIRLGGTVVSGTGAWSISKTNEIQIVRNNGRFQVNLPAASAIAIFLTNPSARSMTSRVSSTTALSASTTQQPSSSSSEVMFMIVGIVLVVFLAVSLTAYRRGNKLKERGQPVRRSV